MLRRLALALCIGLLLMLVTHALLHPRAGNPGQFRFMHCPRCGQELGYNATLVGKQCPRCAPKNSVYVGTVEPVGAGNQVPFSMKRYLLVLSLEGVALLGVVV